MEVTEEPKTRCEYADCVLHNLHPGMARRRGPDVWPNGFKAIGARAIFGMLHNSLTAADAVRGAGK